MSFLSGIFDDLTAGLKSWFDDLLTELNDGVDNIIAEANDIFRVKNQVKNDLQDLQEAVTKIYAQVAASRETFGNLKNKMVRADKAFDLIHDVFSGELKKFVVDEFGQVHKTIVDSLEEVHKAASLFSSQKTRTAAGIPGVFAKFVLVLNRVLKIWQSIARIVRILHEVIPVLEAFAKKLENFEKIILSQKSKPKYVNVRYRFRTRSKNVVSSGFEVDPLGTMARLNQTHAELLDEEGEEQH